MQSHWKINLIYNLLFYRCALIDDNAYILYHPQLMDQPSTSLTLSNVAADTADYLLFNNYMTSQRCDGLPDVSLCVVDAQQTQQRSIAPGSQLQRLLNCCHAAARVVNAGRTQTRDRRTRAGTLFALILISARLHSFSAKGGGGSCCRDGDCAAVDTMLTDVTLVRPHAC